MKIFTITKKPRRTQVTGAVLLFVFFARLDAALAQDSNFLHPIDFIEQRLQYEPFEIFRLRDSRFEGDVTKYAILKWPDTTYMRVKWKKALPGGAGQNNEPRYEIAAYELQKFFLVEESYVVPPTMGRSLPLEQYLKVEKDAQPTFKNTDCVFFVLQYWLENVTQEAVFDKKRAEKDSAYARHLGNVNILSYLIKHKDANVGNFLISKDEKNPRVFAVDNSLAFMSLESNRGVEWQHIRVKRLPANTVAKLRKITKAQLIEELQTVAEFEIKDGQLIPAEITPCLNPKKGVRITDERVQFGLTRHEIKLVYNRLQRLLARIDKGKIETFR